MKGLDGFLERDRDRELFDLAPKKGPTMRNFAETLTRVMDFASTENWMDCGDYLIFGWDEYIKETGQALEPLKQNGLNARDLGRGPLSN